MGESYLTSFEQAMIVERLDQKQNAMFVAAESVEDQSCVLEAGDPLGTFRDYILPRIEDTRQEEASAEVLAFMKSGESFADAVLFTIESTSASKTKKLRKWVEEARQTHIYAYVRIRDIGRHGYVEYGLMLTKGSPNDAIIAKEPHSEIPIQEISEYVDSETLQAALRSYGLGFFSRRKYLLEIDEEIRDQFIEEYEIPMEWSGSGIYEFDFQKHTTRYLGSVADLIYKSVKSQARDILNNMDDDDIKSVCRALLKR